MHMKQSPRFLHCMPPIPWLLATLVAAGLGLAFALGFLDNYTCGEFVPRSYPLPDWTYVLAFVGLCATRGSVWIPMLAAAPLLRLPRRRVSQIALFASLFLGIGVTFAVGHSYTYTSAYGGSWAAMALKMVPFGAAFSLWITLATATVALGTHKLSQRRA